MNQHSRKQPSLKDDVSAATEKVIDGARLRKIRRARGLTQEDLANATGVSRSAVAQWETGRAGLVDKLQKIADALDVPTRIIRPPARLGAHQAASEIHLRESELLNDFRDLTLDDQDIITRLIHRLRRDAL